MKPSMYRDAAILAMTQADIDRFWAKVDKTPGQGPSGVCWIWIGTISLKGYGRFRLRIDQEWLDVFAHRVAWFLGCGALPQADAPYVLHRCDNPPCCNPECLWEGTAADNNADMVRKGRQVTGDRNGARMYPERIRRGERSPNAKLEKADVLAICARFAEGGTNKSDLSKAFGVSRRQIGRILMGERWAHVTKQRAR